MRWGRPGRGKLPRVTTDRPAHLPYLDGLRALLATFVVVHHSWLTVYPPEYGPGPTPTAAAWTGWMSHGLPAVDWFIVLSGYVLMLPVTAAGVTLRAGPTRFYLRRARRILPTFYAALLLTLLLIAGPVGHKTGTHWDICLPVTWRAVLANGLMLQDLWQPGKVNHAFWSVAIESRIYLLFPLVVWAFRRAGPIAAAVLLAGVGVGLGYACRPLGHEDLQLNPLYFALFVLGGLAASRRWQPSLALSIATVATAVAIWQQWNTNVPPWLMRQPMQELAVGLTAAGWLAYWAGDWATVARRVLSWRPLPAVGVFAYSLYLVHAPLVQLSWQWFVRPRGLTGGPALAVLLATALPITIAAAYGFYLVAERPFLSRRQRAAAAEELETEAGRDRG